MHIHLIGQTVFYNKSINLTNFNENIYINDDLGIDSGGFINNYSIIEVNGNIYNYSDTYFSNPNFWKFILNNSDVIDGFNNLHFHNIELRNSNNILKENIYVYDTLELTNSKIDINENVLNLDSTGLIYGENDNSFIFGEEGYIKAVRKMQNSNISNNIACMGFMYSSNDNSGILELIRYGKALKVGTGGIKRYYLFRTQNMTQIDSFKIKYQTEEIPETISHNENSFGIFFIVL